MVEFPSGKQVFRTLFSTPDVTHNTHQADYRVIFNELRIVGEEVPEKRLSIYNGGYH
jgi:hypothetical protein